MNKRRLPIHTWRDALEDVRNAEMLFAFVVRKDGTIVYHCHGPEEAFRKIAKSTGRMLDELQEKRQLNQPH